MSTYADSAQRIAVSLAATAVVAATLLLAAVPVIPVA